MEFYMPNRILREGILKSSRVNALSLGGELFFRRLMSVVDDFGRYEADLSLLRAAVWPRKFHLVTEDEMRAHLEECCAGGRPLISVYTVGADKYLQINNFQQRTRSKTSRYPGPDQATESSETPRSAVKCLPSDRQMTATRQSNDLHALANGLSRDRPPSIDGQMTVNGRSYDRHPRTYTETETETYTETETETYAEAKPETHTETVSMRKPSQAAARSRGKAPARRGRKSSNGGAGSHATTVNRIVELHGDRCEVEVQTRDGPEIRSMPLAEAEHLLALAGGAR